ncbi:MAG: ParA family protein [Syntrophomonadaceae bacterium]|nr:ParA family protein [Syntrophomonadaceae bacterium]MDD4550356.1 ParA family protein [Syntrophomonadaceae bacterium]
MKIISIVSVHPGSGQTTITVNLASGLAHKGCRVLIADMGYNEKLYHWLGIKPAEDSKSIRVSRMGIDLLNMTVSIDIATGAALFSPDIKQLDYDYLLVLPTSKSDCYLLNELSVYVITCTDLSHSNDVADIISLENYLHDSVGRANRISLLVFNKINTKEWEHNSQQLFALADYFGYERISDPIPYCERIHDLQLERCTVWELSQQNLQVAFMSLVETVELL